MYIHIHTHVCSNTKTPVFYTNIYSCDSGHVHHYQQWHMSWLRQSATSFANPSWQSAKKAKDSQYKHNATRIHTWLRFSLINEQSTLFWNNRQKILPVLDEETILHLSLWTLACYQDNRLVTWNFGWQTQFFDWFSIIFCAIWLAISMPGNGGFNFVFKLSR